MTASTFEHGGYQCAISQTHNGDWWVYIRLPERHPLMSLIQDGWGVEVFDASRQWCAYGRPEAGLPLVAGHWWLGYPVPSRLRPKRASWLLCSVAKLVEGPFIDRREAA